MLLRPLLAFRRAALKAYAREQGLTWVDDPSNFDIGIRRNFLRHEILPRLGRVWPGAMVSMARSAEHCAEAAALLDVQAADDLRRVQGGELNQLIISSLLMLAEARQRNVIRYWCRNLGFPVPRTAHLTRIQQDILHSAGDRQPLVNWQSTEIRRYRERIYIMKPLTAFDSGVVLSWDMRSGLNLPSGGGSLEIDTSRTGGFDRNVCRRAKVTVRFRQGGEYCLPVGHRQRKSLKKLFQEAGIPPWQRERLPLVYFDDQLAAIADLWICQPFQAGDAQTGISLCYRPGS